MKIGISIKDIEGYKGGQMEIQNQAEGYFYRGEVDTITVDTERHEIRVKFAWLAELDEGKWVKDNNLDYTMSLVACSANNIGPSAPHIGGGDRLVFDCASTGDFITLFPPDGSKLDPARVEGLQLATA